MKPYGEYWCVECDEYSDYRTCLECGEEGYTEDELEEAAIIKAAEEANRLKEEWEARQEDGASDRRHGIQ